MILWVYFCGIPTLITQSYSWNSVIFVDKDTHKNLNSIKSPTIQYPDSRPVDYLYVRWSWECCELQNSILTNKVSSI